MWFFPKKNKQKQDPVPADQIPLSSAMADSIRSGISLPVGDYLEILVDQNIDTEILKAVPLVSTVVSLYHIGKTIRDQHFLYKLSVFLNEVQRGTADAQEKQKYVEKLRTDTEFHDQQLQYIIILLDRYIGFKKPAYLAKLYLAFLNEQIDLPVFKQYAEALDRFLPGDLDDSRECICYNFKHRASLHRLTALGLTKEVFPTLYGQASHSGGVVLHPPADTGYEVTPYGKKLLSILNAK